MPLTTVAYCHNCKWRSSDSPINYHIAGARCPGCGLCVSALHFDPSYTAPLPFGQKGVYSEAAAAAAILREAGVPTKGPVGVPLPNAPLPSA